MKQNRGCDVTRLGRLVKLPGRTYFHVFLHHPGLLSIQRHLRPGSELCNCPKCVGSSLSPARRNICVPGCFIINWYGECNSREALSSPDSVHSSLTIVKMNIYKKKTNLLPRQLHFKRKLV